MANRCPNCEMKRRHRGFSYLALLILVAILGMSAASAVQVGALAQRRLAEDELLFIGDEFRRALGGFAAATPPGRSRYPRSIDDLLRDPRFPGVRRHLRKLYVDPMTGSSEWGTVSSLDGGIAGIHSLSDAEPIKQQGFEAGSEHLAQRRHYREWIFAVPGAPAAPARP